MLDLSIIIVSWNAKKFLRHCLQSVYQEIKWLSCEVFVVDNASSDGSVEMVMEEFPQTLLLKNQTNEGFAKANNQAIRKSKGRYILLLNPDTQISKGCLINMLDFMDRRPDVGASGCKILNPEGKIEAFRSAKRFPTPLSKFFVGIHLDRIFPRIEFFGRFSMIGWDRNDEREIDVLSGAFMFVRRETVEDVGLLDERFFLLAEDLDWCRRIKQKKWKIFFNPNADIIHFGGKSIDQVKLTRLKNEFRSHFLYFRKHHGSLSAFQHRVLAGLLNILKAIYWFFKYLSGRNRKQAMINLKAYFQVIFYCFLYHTGSIER